MSRAISSRRYARREEDTETFLQPWMPFLKPAVVGLLVVLGLVWWFGSKRGARHDNVYTVRGEVFVKGAPAASAVVTFHPARPGGETRPANATVEEDGSFKLTTFRAFDGAVPGDYRVTVTWADFLERENQDNIYGPDKLDGRYAQPDGSARVVTVEAKTNDIPRFDLN